MSQLRTVLLPLVLSLLFVSPSWAQGELTADIQHFSQNGDFTSFARVRSARILPQLRLCRLGVSGCQCLVDQRQVFVDPSRAVTHY